MLRRLVGVGFAMLIAGWAAGPTAAVAMPAGHLPVYLIPFTKSVVPLVAPFNALVATVITITRVSGTLACDVSVDWRDDAGTFIMATTISTLTPPSATSQGVGGGDTHCSNAAFSSDVVGCDTYTGLTSYQGKAVVGVKAPCNVNNVAVDARLIYFDFSTAAVVAAHSLKVLRPHNLGNKGD
jgi:hypothetical protein